jgi:quinol monooxygenase YgiN
VSGDGSRIRPRTEFIDLDRQDPEIQAARHGEGGVSAPIFVSICSFVSHGYSALRPLNRDGTRSAEEQLRPHFRLNAVYPRSSPASTCVQLFVPDALSMEEKVMTKFALYVPLQAKPGKEKDVADFLRSALPLVNAEAGTVSWFAIQEGPSSFAIFDTFDDEAGRNAHLNGKVAAALMEKAKAGDLFAKTPEIYKLEILADKLPK